MLRFFEHFLRECHLQDGVFVVESKMSKFSMNTIPEELVTFHVVRPKSINHVAEVSQ